MVAYHSVLVFNVLGVSDRGDERRARRLCPTTSSSRSTTSATRYRELTVRNLLESYHDAQQALDMAMNLFGGGYLPLEQRSLAEEALLGDLPQDPAAGPTSWTTCPRSWKGSTPC